MSLGAIHPLKSIMLNTLAAEQVINVAPAGVYAWPTFVCQGYAWFVGSMSWVSLGNTDCPLVIRQGFYNAAAAPAMNWVFQNTITVNGVNTPPGQTQAWKITIHGQLIQFTFTNADQNQAGVLTFNSYLRND